MKTSMSSRKNCLFFVASILVGLVAGYWFILFSESSRYAPTYTAQHLILNRPATKIASGTGDANRGNSLNTDSFKKKLRGLSAYDAIIALAPLRQTDEVRLLRENFIGQLNFETLSPQEVTSLRSHLSATDYIRAIGSYFEHIDVDNGEKLSASISAFERELSTSKTRKAIVLALCSAMKHIDPAEIMRITDSWRQPDLSMEIISQHLQNNALSISQVAELMQFIGKKDGTSQSSILPPVLSSLFRNSPSDAIESAKSYPDPTLLENLLVTNISLESLAQTSVETAVSSATPFVRSKIAKQLANQIIESNTNLSSLDFASTSAELVKEIGNVVGIRLAESMAPESFAKTIKSVSNPFFKEGMTLNINFYQPAEYTDALSILLSK